MKLTDSDIGQFRDLWKKETGKTITMEQAREYAENLLGLVQIVVEPQLHKREEPP
ncbi:MAG: hypothetical protein QF755_04790 [Candidatus Peribacteraceae bacterium]|jgi:hypothetical protein|nr:hypothetical protein [Candidatus Peribacteraceae bacterium]